ncbi:OmpA family protein [Dokdonia sinensis]|nr:OmpA family protein [Dokdonia sinensis]
MKLVHTITLLLFSITLIAQIENDAEYAVLEDSDKAQISSSQIGDNGFKFETFKTGINSEYADYGIGFYREKFLSFSARKIGALAKKDPATSEPFTKLYCSEISYEYDLNRPNLFSHILNKNENLGTVSFSADGKKLFYTASSDNDTQRFQLYSADMNPEREGQFINIELVPFNNPDYSFENPHLSRDGKTLFFASNLPEALGGFDIFQVSIKEDGSYGDVERVEGAVNTVLDEKFPQTSLDGKYLYFSSKGHSNLGGYDIFRSRKADLGYVATRNLGNTINTSADEIAYIPATKTVGYMTSNRKGGKGSYDIYKLTEFMVDQTASGVVLDLETGIPLEKATVVLLDAQGTEVATLQTAPNGTYRFPVDAFLEYTIIAYKDGFENGSLDLKTDTNLVSVFENNLTLKAAAAEIIKTDEKSYIKIDNIQFDYNSSDIKPVSTVTLNTVFQTLKANPDIKVAINAHSDQRGKDSYNLQLSEKRAASVLQYLTDKGISKSRLISKGYGETQPINICDPCNLEQYEENRRVEFVIIPD